MLKKDIKYSYRDVTIVPAKVSEIEHRKDCNPFYPSGTLPLFTAPMDSVVGLENYELYEQHKIIPIIPRTVSLEQRLEVAKTGRWVAYGLEEFEKIFTVQNPGEGYKALIDVANGHMKKLYTLVKKAKALNPNLTVMIGNIANPETYEECCKAGVDYVRCGIGGGNCCFVGDTKITLSNGLKKPISALDIGLEVLTKAGPHRITNVIRKEADKLIKINNNITCTPDHEIFVINKKDQDLVNEENLNDYGFYIKACELNKDTHLLVSFKPEFKGDCKEYEMIKFIEITNIEEINLDNPINVYDLEVEEEHSYIAEDIVVHNCITSSTTNIHFPMASLISEIVEKKQSLQWSGSYKKFTKIIADGGVRGYSDAIVALALGADYVMIGSVFSKMLESSGQIFFRYKDYEKEDDWYPLNWDIYFNRYKSGKFYDFNEYWKGTSEIGDHWRPIELKKEIYGMASGKGQIAIGGKKTKTSEGIIKTIPIEYTMDSWTENFISYLRSAMSYTGAKDLNTFINKTTCIINSPLSVASVNA